MKENFCPESVFTVYETVACFRDCFNLPEELDNNLFETLRICEKYLGKGFSYSFPTFE